MIERAQQVKAPRESRPLEIYEEVADRIAYRSNWWYHHRPVVGVPPRAASTDTGRLVVELDESSNWNNLGDPHGQ